MLVVVIQKNKKKPTKEAWNTILSIFVLLANVRYKKYIYHINDNEEQRARNSC